MKPYPSIETVFVRDDKSKLLLFGSIREPEVSCVKEWTLSEKVDGTNVRVICTLAGIEIRGRSDNANLHPELIECVKTLFPHAVIVEYFKNYRGKELPENWSVTFYGEGYGPGIQKGGVYATKKSFACFDLLLGESWWTDDSEMRRVCLELSIPVVPGLGTRGELPTTRAALLDIIPESQIAKLNGLNSTQAEGIVAKPFHVLLNRHGERVMWKLTFREFKDV